MTKNKISILRFISQIFYLTLFLSGLLTSNYVMLFILISAILVGPIFCGWMCFVGLYQDIARYLGSILIKEPIEISSRLHVVLKYFRYLVLLGSIYLGGVFLFPSQAWGGFSRLIKGHFEVNIIFYFLIALGIISLFTKRFFCRYLCTFGAKLGLYSLLRPVTINRLDSCISCGACTKECLMNIAVDKANSLASPNCINCLKCLEICPNKSLKIGLRKYLKP